jgi:hypothetical protein
MVLREVAAPFRYSVYAFCGAAQDECQVEQFMLRYQGAYPRAIRDLNMMLREWVPQKGPPFESETRAKRLRGDSCEFKAQEKRRKKAPRIMFFQDGRIVVCTNAFMKSVPGSTPDGEIDLCLSIRERYFAAKAANLRPKIRKGWALP